MWLLCLVISVAADTTMVSLEHFIESSCRHDTAFQEILIDELRLRYSEVLALPSSDLLFTIGGEYGVTFSGAQQPEVSVSLGKLFPFKGSSLQLSMSSSPIRTTERRNELDLIYSVDLIRNAFGRSQRMLAHIVGIENQVARYQILQAYETYLVALIQAYYSWMRGHGELLAAQASLVEANKLLDNIRKKKSRYIAYQVDVDKASLQVVNKEERLRQARAAFATATIRVSYSMGKPLDAMLIPDTTGAYMSLTTDAETRLAALPFDSTRTGRIYSALYIRDSLAIARAVDNVLPYLSAYGGLGVSDDNGDIADNTRIMAGVNVSFPLKRVRENALVDIARIDQRQTYLHARSLRGTMNMLFAQLSSSIESQKKAVSLAEQRLELAQSIHDAEAEDYIYGRTRLNDLIQALNTLQANRLLTVNSRIDLARMRLEALELLDQLVTETNIDSLRLNLEFNKTK